MEVSNSIHINGKRMFVSSVISESFVFKASDLTSHTVSVNMSDDGLVSLKIDGEAISSYKKEIVDSHSIDDYVEKLHQRLIGAYERLSDYYLKMYSKTLKVQDEKEIEKLINELKCQKYIEKPFDLKKPELNEIESDLKVEAEGEGFTDSEEIERYVDSHIEECYNYRFLKWEKLRSFYEDIQQVVSKSKNDIYRRQYEEQKRNLLDILEGNSEYVNKRMHELETKLDLPFPTDIDYVYYPSEGQMDIEFESPVSISIPQKRVCMSETGKQVIVRTTPDEDKINQTRCKLATILYIAGSIWNITPKIKKITITNWQLKNQIGWSWVSLERDEFKKMDLDSIDILEAFKNIKHVFDFKKYSLHPMRSGLFEYAIHEGGYNDKVLLRFVNKKAPFGQQTYNKKNVELPKMEEDACTPSINDMDCGYNLSVRPNYDKSFVNWCYRLMEYEDCSLSMFLKDFGMSLDRAKFFMEQLLYLHFVGGKANDGTRKVLIHSENELEYKLSWIFPNESWKY